MKYERVNFPEAVEMLGSRVGIHIQRKQDKSGSIRSQAYQVTKLAAEFYHKTLLSHSGLKYREYLKKRKITEKTVKDFKLGAVLPGYKNLLQEMRQRGVNISLLEKLGLVCASRQGGYIDMFRDRIIFPIYDVKSRVIGFGARRFDDTNKNQPKYINTSESLIYHKGSSLFGLNLAKESIIKNDSCLVVEGYTDMIMPFQQGITNIVASLGTALTCEQIRAIKRYTKNVVLIFDSDIAGKASGLRAIDLMIEEDLNVRAVCLPEGADPDSFVLKEGAERFKALVGGAEDFFFYKLKILKEQFSPDSPRGKSRIIHEMLLTLNKFPSHVVKYEYLKSLAEHLDTDEEFLRLELGKAEPQKNRDFSPAVTEERREVRFAEEYLVKSMLFNQELISIIHPAVTADDFLDPVLRNIVSECFRYWDEHKDLKTRHIFGRLGQDVANRITELMMDDFCAEEKVLTESIAELKRKAQKTKRKLLRAEIKQAEEDNDQRLLVKLVQDYQELIRQDELRIQ